MGTTMSGFAAVVAIGLILATGCSQPAPPPRGPAKPAVKPKGNLVPPTGGGDVPEATLAACRDCQRMLKEGKNEALLRRMRHAALQQAPGGQAVQPSTRAVELVCAGAAKTNLGRHADAITSLEKADEHRDDLPEATRRNFLELLYHAQLISYTATGRPDQAQRALTRLVETGQDPARYVEQACSVADTLPECRPEEPAPSPSTSPTGEPEQTPPTSAPAETQSSESEPEVEPPVDPGPDEGNPEPEGPGPDEGEPAPVPT